MAVSESPGRSPHWIRDAFERLESRITRVGVAIRQRAGGQSVALGLAAAVGLGTGLLAAALVAVIGLVQEIVFGSDPSTWRVLLGPAVGALVVGVLVTYWAPESRGSGVVQVMRSLGAHGGRMRWRVPVGGVVASGLALGAGVSGGREGPIVLIGGGVGSLLARLFSFDEERRRGLIAAGAAAGIGASFNAPIGGMLFAIELILGGLRARSLQMVVIASVVASVTISAFSDAEIIYEPESFYQLGDPRELLLYLLLGLAAVAAGLLLQYSEHWMTALFERVRVWRPLRLAVAGLGVGAIALWVPEVLGTGGELPPVSGLRVDEPIQAMINNEAGLGFEVVGFLLLLAVAKLVATVLTIGSGNPIGTFAPMLFIGAALGGAFGNTALELLPGFGIQPGAFALVGMAAVFSAGARAPLTAILIVFELTGDYELVLPLMLAAGVATLVADRIQPESIYTMPLRHEGIIASDPEEIDLLQTVTVESVMTTDPLTVPPDMALPELRATVGEIGHAVPVLHEGRLLGVVAPADFPSQTEQTGVAEAGSPTELEHQLTAADVCTRHPVTVGPTDPVYRAMRRMASLDIGMVPVVDPRDPERLAGVVRREDLVEAYRQAANRSLGVQQRREASQLRDLGGARFLELAVHAGAPVADRAVRDIPWPDRAVLTGVHRDGELVLPDGNTVVEAGDRLVVLTDRANAEELRRLTRPEGDAEA